jgi:UDP-glucuronate 4-epimerase
MAKILLTGAAGFIGFHVAKRLLERGDQVLGLDSLNDYYDVSLKYARLALCGVEQKDIQAGFITEGSNPDYRLIQLKLEDKAELDELFQKEKFDAVINLAAQAGVRYSLVNPQAYVNSNIVGFVNILEACRHYNIGHLVYASSSSVYGLNEKLPFSTADNVDHPISLYAASKKSNELMAHTYSHLFGLPTTGLRFFTAYGPWGRPDMALFLFTQKILAGTPIDIYNEGQMLRDFTYIDDLADGVIRVLDQPPPGQSNWDALTPDPASSAAPYRIFNIGNNEPVKLMDFVEAIEVELGKKAIKNLMPLQAGDVPATFADVSPLQQAVGYRPKTSVKEGIAAFVKWYREYYKV